MAEERVTWSIVLTHRLELQRFVTLLWGHIFHAEIQTKLSIAPDTPWFWQTPMPSLKRTVTLSFHSPLTAQAPASVPAALTGWDPAQLRGHTVTG